MRYIGRTEDKRLEGRRIRDWKEGGIGDILEGKRNRRYIGRKEDRRYIGRKKE